MWTCEQSKLLEERGKPEHRVTSAEQSKVGFYRLYSTKTGENLKHLSV